MCEDNIKINLKIIEMWVVWDRIHLAQDRD
jgi:hypothetical protein